MEIADSNEGFETRWINKGILPNAAALVTVDIQRLELDDPHLCCNAKKCSVTGSRG